MTYVNFEELKAKISIEKAAELLGLKLKPGHNQSRGPCPVCTTAGERAMVITPSKGWYCWGAKKGGDIISLTAHIRQCSTREAAEFLAGDSRTSSSPSPESAAGKEGARTLQPLAYLEQNEAVEAIGFSLEFAKKHGIGFAPKGVCRGSVAIPFRDEHGTLLGYLAVQELMYIPPDFTPNVVPFAKKAS